MAMEQELSRIANTMIDNPKKVRESIRYLKHKEIISEQCADLLRYAYSICKTPKRMDICEQDKSDVKWASEFLKKLK